MQEGPQRERGNVRDGGTASRPLPATKVNFHRTEMASRSMISPTSPKARLSNITTHVGHGATPEGKSTQIMACLAGPGVVCLGTCAVGKSLESWLYARQAPKSLTWGPTEGGSGSLISAYWYPRDEFSTDSASVFPNSLVKSFSLAILREAGSLQELEVMALRGFESGSHHKLGEALVSVGVMTGDTLLPAAREINYGSHLGSSFPGFPRESEL